MAAVPGTRFGELRGAPASGAQAGAPRRCLSCGAQYPGDFLVCPKDGTALARDDHGGDPLVGEVLAGTFCITSVLGEGGMGKVYEAEHVRLPRRFAIKVMHDELVKHAEAVARFEREAQAVARVTSEHVIEVVDLVRLRDGRPCLVTELLEGQELGELLDRSGKLPLATAVTVARQVCRGLAAAHAVGVVHRDLKPSNLFLVARADGKPFAKILDFGVAKLADGANLTLTGMVVGTPAYMSPEQARGDRNIDERADVYSLGAVIYHMLTGSPPFDGDEPGMVLTRVLTEDPPRPRGLNRSIPDGLEHLVQRAMARTPEGRPRSAAELEAELAVYDVEAAPARAEGPPSGPAASVRFGSIDTVIAPPVPTSAPSLASPVGRWSRLGAMMTALAFGLAIGAAAFASIAAGIRFADPAAAPRRTEQILVAVVSSIAALVAFGSGVKMVGARWRSAPAIDRLGTAFSAAFTTLFATLGVLALAHVDVAVVLGGEPVPPRMVPLLQLGTVAGPLVAGVVVYLAGTRRARRMG